MSAGRVSTRNTTVRDRHRSAIRRTKPPCSLCEQPIDYTLPHLDPMAYVVDHIVPLNKGGLDVLENCQPAHRACNRAKSDKTTEDLAPRTFVTSRSW
jgi:5-methylcytosine-specific restriction endonuclease McrA